MKKIVFDKEIFQQIHYEDVGVHGCLGLQRRYKSRKYIAAQTGNGEYQVLTMTDSSGLNRYDNTQFNGITKVVEAYKENFEMYLFDTSEEMLKWLIS